MSLSKSSYRPLVENNVHYVKETSPSSKTRPSLGLDSGCIPQEQRSLGEKEAQQVSAEVAHSEWE